MWSFSCAFSVRGGFFCVRYLMCCFGIIWLHCCAGFWIRIWSFLVGLSVRVWKFLFVRKVCAFLAYSCLYIITVALLLSARLIIAFSFVILWLTFLVYIVVSCICCGCCGWCCIFAKKPNQIYNTNHTTHNIYKRQQYTLKISTTNLEMKTH